jgi:hypothetical protein
MDRQKDIISPIDCVHNGKIREIILIIVIIIIIIIIIG